MIVIDFVCCGIKTLEDSYNALLIIILILLRMNSLNWRKKLTMDNKLVLMGLTASSKL